MRKSFIGTLLVVGYALFSLVTFIGGVTGSWVLAAIGFFGMLIAHSKLMTDFFLPADAQNNEEVE